MSRDIRSQDMPATDTGEPDVSPVGFLAEAVDRINHGVVVVDASGVEVYRNTAAARFSEARDGRTLVESCVERLLAEAREGRSANESVELFGPPAQLYLVTARPFPDAGSVGAMAAMAVVEDRSESRRTETVRRDFVANISHELKTPVGALGLLAETIKGEDDPEVMRRLADRMVTEADRAARTIDDLLELSRIEFAGEDEYGDVDLVAVVGEALSRISNAAEQAGVELHTDVARGLVIHGDRRQLVSAVFNLLDNAVKYSPQGSSIEVTSAREAFTAESGKTMALLTVTDHGIGIPRRSLERIFERFYRVDRARSRNTGGTGLGLAIVRHVVSNHHGEIRAESIEGQGSAFTLLLPCGAETTAVPADRSTSMARPEAPGSTAGGPTTGGSDDGPGPEHDLPTEADAVTRRPADPPEVHLR